MIKIVRSALFLFLFCGFCHLKSHEGTLEIRSAAFFPASPTFRDAYGKVNADYQIQATATYCSCYELWTNLDWFYKHKRRDHCCNTKIRLANASFGVNQVFPLCGNLDAYAGIGVSFGHTILHNDTCCNCKEWISKYAFGGVLKSGIRYYFENCVFVDCFADYLYQPFHFHKDVDVGGLKIGIGLGMQF